MTARRVFLSLLLVVLAVLAQTTIFHSVRPFGESPDVVLLIVIACVQWLRPEPGVILGFIGGLLLDLLGTAPLGLHGLAFTLAAYATVRVGDRFNYGIHFTVSAVGLITFIGLATVALIGTLFGEGTLGSPGILKTFLLVPVYNMVLALGMLPLIAKLFTSWSSSRYGRPGGLL